MRPPHHSFVEDAVPDSTPGRAQRVRLAGLILCALATAQTGAALQPTTPSANDGRQAWSVENGLPQNTVQALAQSQDGFLWVGTEVGLARFDGYAFQTFDTHSMPGLPGNDIRALLAMPDGSLWIGTSEGLARWREGAIRALDAPADFEIGEVIRLERDGSGGILVETNHGWIGCQDKHWVKFPKAPVGVQMSSFLPPNLPGILWAVGNRTAVEVSRGKTVVANLVAGKDLPGNRIQSLYADREGALWIGTNGGLARWVDGRLERMPVTDPLASASVLTIMEDREGDLWVGTETSGLQVLRDQRFQTLGAREGLSSENETAVLQDAAGTLWVGTAGSGLNALKPGAKPEAVKKHTTRNGLLSDVILSLASAANGDLWVGTPDGLNRIHGGRVDGWTSADGLPDEFIRSLLVDADGSLWIGTRHGLAHWMKPGGKGSPMAIYTQANGLGSDLVGALARDAHGELWVATLNGLSRLHEGMFTNYTTADGLASNVVTALLARPDGTLLIGLQDHGWNLWDGQWIAQASALSPAQTSIHAILDDRMGHLWFATSKGIARCDCDRAMKLPACSHWVEFGVADGLRSREMATNSHPSAWRGSNGLLWFATPKGLIEADPAHFPADNVAPPVALERFVVDDVAQSLLSPAAPLRIPAGHVHFEFDYAAMSFAAPQKTRYRFMLEGVDHDWIEAGTRRSAYYTSIAPGRYAFRVQAANGDGVWNREGAALAFELQPHFWQTLWFYALLLLLAAALVGLVIRLRLLRAEREFKAVLGERSRIAREIHDTLAQGYVGISVQLEVMAELLRMNKTDAAAKHLDLTRGYVREGLADARQSIWALRSQDAGETTLPVRLRRLVEAEDGHGLTAHFSIFGAYRPLPPGTERELLRVAQEAIQNVKKHAAASQLIAQLEYGRDEIALEVRDDGRGFEPDANAGEGHYGLTGMRERAALIGGQLQVTSGSDKGTTVRLRAPAPRNAGNEIEKEQP